MRKLLTSTAIILALSTPAFAQQTPTEPTAGTAVEASSELKGAATAPNTSDDKEITSQAAAPEVQVKQDAEEATPKQSAVEEHKDNVMNGGNASQSAETDTTTTPVPGMNTAQTDTTKTMDSNTPTTESAATQTEAADKFVAAGEKQFRASNLIGMRIYATENDVDATATAANNGRDQWEDIGEINDLVVSTNGDVTAVILGIGGFLGIGEKDVAVNISELSVVREADDKDDYFLVVKASRAELESAPTFERVSSID